MQKKIVAAICAAALALAMPVAAFAANNGVWVNFEADATQKSMATANIGEIKGDNVTLKNVVATGVAKYVSDITADTTGTTIAVPSNAVANSVQSFKFQAQNNKRNDLKSFGTKYDNLSGQIEFAEGVTANLTSAVDATNNLYVVTVFKNEKGEKIWENAKKLTVEANGASPAAAEPSGFDIDGAGSGVLTVWMQNGKYAIDGAAQVSDLNESAKDGSKSPKTGELL